jgi:sugar transferase (PEP-CTERM system associated)
MNNPAVIRTLLLIMGDILLGWVVFYAGIYIRFGELNNGLVQYEPLFPRVSAFVLVILFWSFFAELYSNDKNYGRKDTFLRIMTAILLSFFTLSALYYLLPFIEVGRGTLALSITFFGIFQTIWRLIYDFCSHLPGIVKRVLVFGTGPIAAKIGHLIDSTNHQYVLAGYVNCPSDSLSVPESYIIDSFGELLDTARKEQIHKLVISISERRGTMPIREILDCKLGGIDVLDAPSFYEQVSGKVLLESIRPSWFIFSDGFRITPSKRFLKRVFDIFFSSIGLIISLPFIPLIGLAIRLDSPGPIFFKQVRRGQGEKIFTLYKFRTMKNDAESETGAVWAEKDDPRVTKMGRFLRKSRLDEIPQLLNVLKGDMSFVGPRPERPEFVKKLKEVIPYYHERHTIKPGLTGWAQIKYSYGASVDDSIEKLRYDLYYIKRFSLFLDLLIILETIKVVLFGRGGR